MQDFEQFIVVDWTGAKGPRLPGLKVAACAAGDGAPALIPPPERRHWSRRGVLDWLLGLAQANIRALIGFDFCFTAPHADRKAYFPGADMGAEARALWRKVDDLCVADADLGAVSLPAHPALATHFLRPGARGARFVKRLRVTEHVCRAEGLGAAESVFHLIGPSQVGLASFSGMRLLHRLDGVAIWPCDAPDPAGPTVVEFFTRRAIRLAGLGGKKIRNAETLNRGLAQLGSAALTTDIVLDDHATDALISAAALRRLAEEPRYWRPARLSASVLASEGWTFGIP